MRHLSTLLLLVSLPYILADQRNLVCEHEVISLQCPAGSVINVKDALYGKKELNQCYQEGNYVTDCSSKQAKSVVSNQCNDRRQCQVKAENSVFGDPCHGTIKYLEVTFDCVKESHTTKFACEHEKLIITCSKGYRIRIVDAKYGRSEPNTCIKSGVDVSKTCSAPSALAAVISRCDDQLTCTVDASNSVFGDPCVGTYKYLEVTYGCVQA